jgi:hypothetical protein
MTLKKSAIFTFGLTLALTALVTPLTTHADVRLKRILKITGGKEYFTGGEELTTFQASTDGKRVAMQSQLTVGDNYTLPQIRFLSSPSGKPSLLVKRGKLLLENGQEVTLQWFELFRLSPDGLKIAIKGAPETTGSCSTCAFVIDTASGRATELLADQFTQVAPQNNFELVPLAFGSSSRSLYVRTRQQEYPFPYFTPVTYISLFRYDTTTKTTQLLHRTESSEVSKFHYVTKNEAFALGLRERDTDTNTPALYRIDLATGAETLIFARKDLEVLVGLWLSEDGETAMVSTDDRLAGGWVPKLIRVQAEKETVITCKDKRGRYSSKLNSPTVSTDGRFATFNATNNASEGEQGPMNHEVGVLNLSTGSCAYLGEGSRFLSNDESALAGDGSSLFFVQRLRKPGSDQTLMTTLFSTATAGVFRRGVKIK